MHLRTAALVFLSATLFGSTVYAEDVFTISGTDSSVPYSLQFDLPGSFLNSSLDTFGDYELSNVPILVDGAASETATLDIIPDDILNISLNDPGSDTFGLSLDSPYTATDGTTTTFVVPSSISGSSFVDCTSRLVMPGRSALPTLAMLQLPTFTTSCGDAVTLAIGSVGPAAVTPEPPSVTLLALGAFGGLAGVFGRALWGRFRFMA